MTISRTNSQTQHKRFVDTQKSDKYGRGMKTSGAQKLRAWIDGTGRKIRWLASEIPVDRSHLHQWLNGTYTPRRVYRIRIAEVTGGAVPVDSWNEGGNAIDARQGGENPHAQKDGA
jgi:hypothetical protein